MKKKPLWMMAVVGMAALSVCAQTNEAVAGSAGADESAKTFLDLILEGGWAMIPLGLLSLTMIYFIVQNFMSLREKTMLRNDLMPDLLKMMARKDIQDAVTLCEENPALFTMVLSAGLERCLDERPDFERVKESIEEATVEQMAHLMKPIDYLSIIGAIAPMLGLLGTVSGMIKAFQTMSSKGMGRPELLAGNIGEALMTTATGLVIAIPAMLFFFYFKKGFNKTLATLGRHVGFLFDTYETGKMPLSYKHLNDEL
jgi:biopolymer transport protein ExbB